MTLRALPDRTCARAHVDQAHAALEDGILVARATHSLSRRPFWAATTVPFIRPDKGGSPRGGEAELTENGIQGGKGSGSLAMVARA